MKLFKKIMGHPLTPPFEIEWLDEPVFVFSNEGALVQYNKAGAELLALPLLMTMQPKTLDRFQTLIAPHFFSKNGYDLDLGGTPYRFQMTPIDHGTVLRFFPTAVDKHLERLSAALAAMPWGVMSVDLSLHDPRVIYCNERTGMYLGTKAENIVFQKISDVLRVFGIQEDMGSFIKGNIPYFFDYECQQNGKITWFRFHFIPYVENLPQCLIVVEDTSAQKLREAQYAQAQRLESLGQLAAGVAHDFNNILAIIDGYTRLASKNPKDTGQVSAYLERIKQSVTRGSAITSHLLTFGRHKISKEGVCCLNELIRDQRALIRPLMDASIRVSIEAEENLYVDVVGDDICQILLNLCINSRDAMPNGGDILIEAGKTRKNQIFLRVTDTGHGMTENVKARIFDPFFTTKEQGKGTGLGLSMVYGMVKDMNGEIEVNSRPGQGTEITIFLPQSVHQPDYFKADLSSESEQTISSLKGYTALIAEDEPDLLNLMSGMLEELGMRVLKASNGNEALLVQDSYDGEIDMLLTDVVMPELNGVKLAELFASLRPDSRVIFMSGYPAQGQLSRVSLPENALLLSKPVNPENLGNVIRTSLMKDRATNANARIGGQWKSAS